MRRERVRRRPRRRCRPRRGDAGARPLSASTRHSSSVRWSSAAPSKPNARRSPSRMAAVLDVPASRISVSALARARVACAARRAARATNMLIATATARNTNNARRCSGWPTVKVWSGGVRYQLTRRNPSTATTSAGHRPPIADTQTTSSRNSSSELDGDTWSRAWASPHVRSGAPSTPTAKPSATRLRGSARGRRSFGSDAASVSPPASRPMTCTSRPTPDSLITVLTTEP